jgi:hypothetical protein
VTRHIGGTRQTSEESRVNRAHDKVLATEETFRLSPQKTEKPRKMSNQRVSGGRKFPQNFQLSQDSVMHTKRSNRPSVRTITS